MHSHALVRLHSTPRWKECDRFLISSGMTLGMATHLPLYTTPSCTVIPSLNVEYCMISDVSSFFLLATVCGWHLHVVASFIVASLTSSGVSCFTGWRTATITFVHSLPSTLSGRSVLTLCQQWPSPFLSGTRPQCHTSVSVRACLEGCMVLCPLTSWW